MYFDTTCISRYVSRCSFSDISLRHLAIWTTPHLDRNRSIGGRQLCLTQFVQKKDPFALGPSTRLHDPHPARLAKFVRKRTVVSWQRKGLGEEFEFFTPSVLLEQSLRTLQVLHDQISADSVARASGCVYAAHLRVSST